jgi:hypothetical protein
LLLPLTFLYAFYLKIEPILPWTIIRFIYSFCKNENHKRFLLLIIFFLVQSLLWVGPVDPIRQIDDYCTSFDNQYGTNHPAFYRGKLYQALQDAQREVRLLFIYLHDKNSPLCDRFCR